MTSASRTSLTPSACATLLDGVDEEDRADDDQPDRRRATCSAITRSADRLGSRRRALRRADAYGAVRDPRRARGPRPPKMALDIPDVQADQHDRDDPPADEQVRTAGTRPRWPAVADEEVAQVVDEDAGIDRERRAGRARRAEHEDADPVTNIASVESMNGAPRIAPTPTACRLPRREDDGDDRDQCLGQCRADGGQHGPDRALAETELATQPLDAVGEELRAPRG